MRTYISKTIGSLRIILVLAFGVAFASPTLADQKNVDAPVDEYFGRQHMSTLGIDNLIRDTDQRESVDPAFAARLYGGLMAAEDAIEDWAAKYPHDGWIPKRAYEMSHLFWRMHLAEANAAAERCRTLLFRQFPESRYAALAHAETPTLTAANPTFQTQRSQAPVVSDPWQRFASPPPSWIGPVGR
jgi:hypothetical protein